LSRLKNYDFILIITPVLLSLFGLLMIYSSSMVTAIVEGNESTHYFVRQLIWFILGMGGFVFASIFPYKKYQRLIKVIILVTVFLLIGVLLFGTTINNAKSWFIIGPISIQPAELAKLALIMYLASVYSKKQSYIDNFTHGVLPPLILTVSILGLIIMQPDIGTAAILFLIAAVVIFSSGIKTKHLLYLMLAGLLFLLAIIPTMITDTRISRFTGAFQPFEQPESAGYHLIQSYIAIAGGGVTGEGLGQSVQKLGYLMEAHTDFIMAVIAEELGFFGVVIVVGMLAIIVIRGIFISRKCEDSFGSLLAIGISSMVGIQSIINLGAISGLLPITGVPLPFVSYGGSALLILLFSMGLLNNIAMTVKTNNYESLHKSGESNISHEKIYNSYRGGRTWQN